MTKEQRIFIETIGNAAREYRNEYDILPSLVIAMAIKESNWGKSKLSQAPNYNFFGMKWTTKCGTRYVEMYTKEYDKTAGKYVTVSAKFRAYDTLEEGIAGFYQFITGYKRYANLIGEKDPAQACIKIQKDGWATAPTYATSLYNDYILKYNLTSYDGSAAPEIPDVKPYYIKGKVYTTEVNLYIREAPSGRKRKMYEITANARINSYADPYGDAVLKAGTRVTCLDTVQEGNSTWIRIPSGYICAVYNNKTYVGGV